MKLWYLCFEHVPLAPEDRGPIWVISIESLIGERNKIKSIKAKNHTRKGVVFCISNFQYVTLDQLHITNQV